MPASNVDLVTSACWAAMGSLQILLALPEVQYRPDLRDEFFVPHGLAQIANSATLETSDPVVGVTVVAREQHDGDVGRGRIGGQPLTHFKAIEHRHMDVQ